MPTIHEMPHVIRKSPGVQLLIPALACRRVGMTDGNAFTAARHAHRSRHPDGRGHACELATGGVSAPCARRAGRFTDGDVVSL